MLYLFYVYDHFSLFLIAGVYVYLISIACVIILENRTISSTLAWMLVFVLLPVMGFLLYIFFGRDWKIASRKKKQHILQIYEKLNDVLYDLYKKQNQFLKKYYNKRDVSYGIERMWRVLHASPDAVLTFCNDVNIFYSGEEKFKFLKEDLKKAKKSIHCAYFIWRDDKLTKEISDILIDKVQSGVSVRVLYDPIGSFITRVFHHKYFHKLKKNGVIVVPFYNKLSPLKFTTINHALHRKIIVIDNVIGYTGGMNMGQEYIDGGKRFDKWRDTHVRIVGESVRVLQAIFAMNWEETTKRNLFKKKYFVQDCALMPKKDLLVQIISSEPQAYWHSIKLGLISMILAARRYIFIQTPYFIPDVHVYEALKIAAIAGVDVRIMVTGVPDKKIIYWAAFTYFEELLDARVKIYHYKKGFLHAKTAVIDGKVCSIGTTNMDMRSIHLSHEDNIIIYDEIVAQQQADQFKKDLLYCRRFTIQDYNNISTIKKFRNSLVRLLSPLL